MSNIIQFKSREQMLDEEKLKLNYMAMKYGLRDDRTIAQSHVVDELIVPIQRDRLRGYLKAVARA